LRKLPAYVAFPDRFKALEVERLRGFKPAAAASDELISGGTGTAVDVRFGIDCVNTCGNAVVKERVQMNASFNCILVFQPHWQLKNSLLD
jgi:hypothetical protein